MPQCATNPAHSASANQQSINQNKRRVQVCNEKCDLVSETKRGLSSGRCGTEFYGVLAISPSVVKGAVKVKGKRRIGLVIECTEREAPPSPLPFRSALLPPSLSNTIPIPFSKSVGKISVGGAVCHSTWPLSASLQSGSVTAGQLYVESIFHI